MRTSFKSYLKMSLRLGFTCLVEWMLFLPVWILLQNYLQPGSPALPWMYTLPLLSITGMLLSRVCRRKWQQLLAALLIGATAILLSFPAPALLNLPLAVISVVFPYLGLTVGSRKNKIGIYVSGIALYFIAAIIMARIPELKSSLTLLTWSGSLSLVLALLDTNALFLRYSSFTVGTTRLPSGLRRHNLIFVILFIGVAAALAAGAGKTIGLLLLNSTRSILNWLTSLFSTEEKIQLPEDAPPPLTPLMPAAPDQNPGWLAMFLEILFYAIGAGVILLLLYFAVRWIYKNTGGVLRRGLDLLLSMLRRQVPEEHRAYHDEEESVFAWKQTLEGFRHYWRDKWKTGAPRDRWEGMKDSRERTRWLYRQWLREKRADGYEAKKYLTPQETAADVNEWAEGRKRQRKGDSANPELRDGLLRLYNQARYGGEEPPASEVSALKEKLKM